MAEDERISKRIIISGLTPAITVEDLSRRLTSFGTVKAADGFGLVDGLGQPRKFGYVTLETTKSKLARCMNLLSGSTWKGAKLRFGEAKPDYRERIALENDLSSEPPRKRRKRNVGVESEDMSLVTPDNAASRKQGWTVSELGRITQPIKTRPLHPLPPKLEPVKSKNDKKNEKGDSWGEKKKKKRVKEPDNRARRRTIDMVKYGSTHLKGVFLDLHVPTPSMSKEELLVVEPVEERDSDSESESDEEAEVKAQLGVSMKEPAIRSKPTPPECDSKAAKTVEPAPSPSTSKRPTSTRKASTSPPPKSTPLGQASSTQTHLPSAATDLQLEKQQTLNFLASLFDTNSKAGLDDGQDEWIGRESPGSDVDVDELVKGDRMLDEGEDLDFEIVPRDGKVKDVKGKEKKKEKKEKSKEGKEEKETIVQPVEDENDADLDVDMDADPTPTPSPEPTATKKATTTTKLKDLFAPREDEGGFSLLGHLDLDLDMDMDMDMGFDLGGNSGAADSANVQQVVPATTTAAASRISTTEASQSTVSKNVNTGLAATITLDPNQALFFPSAWSFSPATTKPNPNFSNTKNTSSTPFFKTETDAQIRARWEESRGELTRIWKKRAREGQRAKGGRRGRVGDGAGAGEEEK